MESIGKDKESIGYLFGSPNLGLREGLSKGIQWKDSLLGSLFESLFKGLHFGDLNKKTLEETANESRVIGIILAEWLSPRKFPGNLLSCVSDLFGVGNGETTTAGLFLSWSRRSLNGFQDHKWSLLKGEIALKKAFNTTLIPIFSYTFLSKGLWKTIGTPKKVFKKTRSP